MRRTGPIIAVFIIQAACAYFFVADILASVFGIKTGPISWAARERIEIGAAVGLVLGVVLGGIMLRRALRQRNVAEERLR